MEEPENWSQNFDQRLARTAEALRTLRAQADGAIKGNRRRWEEVERELAERVKAIAKSTGNDQEADAEQQEDAEQRIAEIDSANEQLADNDRQLAEARNQLSETRGQLAAVETEHEELAAKVYELQTEQAEQVERISSLEHELEDRRGESQAAVDRIAELEQQLGGLDEAKAASESREQELQQQLEDCQRELSELRDAHAAMIAERDDVAAERNDLARRNDELASGQEASQSTSDELSAQCEALRGERDQLAQERDNLIAERDQLAAERDELSANRDAAMAERDAVQAALDEMQQAPCHDCEQLREELASATGMRSELEEQLEAATAGQQTTDAELAAERERSAQMQSALETAEQRIVELQENTEVEDELAKARQKFELALADVQKFKLENSELHEELANRPAADEQESAELLHLRQQCDQLKCEVEELKASPPEANDAALQQELADLQRRFELAVGEVRDLKHENAELQTQLSAGTSQEPPLTVDGTLDWQAQKEQLLRSLAAEDADEEIGPERSAERARIEQTIEATDRALAERESEIAELRAKLTAAQQEPPAEEAGENPLAELFDADEAIQAERSRLTALQEEMEQKLRKAELELSVERAKIAREKAAMDEQLHQLQEAAEEAASSDGKPKRRWLSKLGLKDDEDDERS